jgi:FkbM family methyltransferase
VQTVYHRALSAWYWITERRDRMPGARVRRGVTPHGFTLIARNDAASRAMIRGTFEPDEAEWIAHQLEQADVLIDAGAHVGYFSALARHRGRAVVVIEPQRRNLECLRATGRANQWDTGIDIHETALGSRQGVARLFGASDTRASLIPGFAGVSPRRSQMVPMTTLDALLTGRFAGARLLIKVDVEGHEYDVLRGAAETLARMPRPRWLVEVCLDGYHPGHVNPAFGETFDLFWRHGYEARTADAAARIVRPVDVDAWCRSGRCESGVINYTFTQPE